MKDIILSGKQVEEFRAALNSAFPTYANLKQMLRIKLEMRLEQVVSTGALDKVAFDLIEKAEAEGWLFKLLLGARAHNEGNQRLKDFEESVGLATREFGKSELEAKIHAYDQFISLGDWLPKLNRIESQVCRIEISTNTGVIYGTGFLIAPDVILTNYHVVADVILGHIEPTRMKARFDYKKLSRSMQGKDGVVYDMAADWCIHYSENSPVGFDESAGAPALDQLDYALLRLNQPLTERGYVEFPTLDANLEASFQKDEPLVIVQHPEGTPIKLGIAMNGVLGLNPNKTRLFYTTRTEGGSSGSPCFNLAFDLIALHHSGLAEQKNAGTPITTLINYWESKGLDWKNGFGRPQQHSTTTSVIQPHVAVSTPSVHPQEKSTASDKPMSKEAILALINPNPMDLDRAFEILDEKIGNDFTYNNLKNSYMNPAGNFEIVNFCSRLKLFVRGALS